MTDISRRDFITAVSVMAGATSTVAAGSSGVLAADRNGFMAASSTGPGPAGERPSRRPGIQGIHALCEVTGGGQKVYGIAVEYDTDIDAASLALDTYSAGVIPAARGFFPGMPQEPDKNATTDATQSRPVFAIYTNSEATLRSDGTDVAGKFVIAEFRYDPDLSLPTTDSDKVTLIQVKDIRTQGGAIYAAAKTIWDNAGSHGNSVVIRGVDAWEQNHWWWDDSRSAWLEYSIYLPKSFLKKGGENKSYPLLLAITHSGTSYDGTCAQTLTEQCIATI